MGESASVEKMTLYVVEYAVAMERKAWSEPVAAGAISERGRQQVHFQSQSLSTR